MRREVQVFTQLRIENRAYLLYILVEWADQIKALQSYKEFEEPEPNPNPNRNTYQV